MRHAVLAMTLLLCFGITGGALAQKHVEILETSDESMDRGAFKLFRKELLKALRESGFDATSSRLRLSDRQLMQDGPPGYYIDIVAAQSGPVVADQQAVAGSPSANTLITRWGGMATVELNVYDIHSATRVATYKFSGVDTGLAGYPPGGLGMSHPGSFGRGGNLLLGLIAGAASGGYRADDAARAVSRDIVWRMESDLKDR